MSRYSKLLATTIAESKCTAKEIVKRCNEIGNGIDETRLSKLQSGKLSAPSAKVSRDIAKACGVDERKLVIEGYLEKAPLEIVEAFKILKENSILAGLKIFENAISKEQINAIKEIIANEPLSDCIVEILDSKEDIISVSAEKVSIDNKEFKFLLEEPTAIQVKDDAMFPIIPKKAKVILKFQEEYVDGDILALKTSSKEDIIIRYALFKNDEIVLTALNKEYEKLMYKKDNITIMGKVVKVTIDI